MAKIETLSHETEMTAETLSYDTKMLVNFSKTSLAKFQDRDVQD